MGANSIMQQLRNHSNEEEVTLDANAKSLAKAIEAHDYKTEEQVVPPSFSG